MISLVAVALGGAVLASILIWTVGSVATRRGPAPGPPPTAPGRNQTRPTARLPMAAAIDPDTLECPVSERQARAALRSGVAALRSATRPRVDATWALQHVLDRHPEFHPRDALGGRPLGEPSSPARRLLDPSAVGGRLPQPDSAAGRYNDEVNAVFRPPGADQVAAIDRFTARPGQTGYVLTHQWLELIWAKQLALDLPTATYDRTAWMEAAVRAEVGVGTEPLDLWAERTALLAAFGTTVAPADRNSWLCRAVRTQDRRGVWLPDGVYRQRYESATFTMTSEPEHLTALMVLLLGSLLPPA